MENLETANLAERLEARRYRLILWQTIGFALWFTPFLFLFWGARSPYVIGALLVPFLPGMVIFAVANFRLTRVVRQITSDPELRSAVNNELFIANDYKAGVWGYYVTMFAIMVTFALSIFIDIPGKVMGGILVWVCALSAKVAQLIVHRG